MGQTGTPVVFVCWDRLTVHPCSGRAQFSQSTSFYSVLCEVLTWVIFLLLLSVHQVSNSTSRYRRNYKQVQRISVDHGRGLQRPTCYWSL